VKHDTTMTGMVELLQGSSLSPTVVHREGVNLYSGVHYYDHTYHILVQVGALIIWNDKYSLQPKQFPMSFYVPEGEEIFLGFALSSLISIMQDPGSPVRT